MTPKQQRFVLEYVLDGNGTRAAIRAGYSTRTARAIASENLTKPDICAAIQRCQEERAARLQLETDLILFHFHNLYMQAREADNISAALRALDCIAKHLGFYEPHNWERVRADTAAHERFSERGVDSESLKPPERG